MQYGEVKFLRDFKDYTFLINFEYKLNKDSVLAFLDEIYNFLVQNNDDKFLFLQSIKVKSYADKHYRVIKGRHKLLTLYYLLDALNHKIYSLVKDEKESALASIYIDNHLKGVINTYIEDKKDVLLVDKLCSIIFFIFDCMQDDTSFIKNLDKLKFFIPSYQRGYRWTDREVLDLLNDINDIHDLNTVYCLQPLIVKRKDGNDMLYEVIDGQQRLTTIFIILLYLENPISYEIEYETRSGSRDFLNSLNKSSNNISHNSNIDFFHIKNAYDCVKEFFKDKADLKNTFLTKLLNNVFFIWYEILDNKNSIEIFTRVNMGKIPLTNAELIKAIIFNKDNFKDSNEILQQEIALSWNMIERDLNNESFWHFLVGKNTNYATRIDLIFDVLATNDKNKLQNYGIFLSFYRDYKDSKDKELFVKNLWQDVELVHDRFVEWYNNLDYYHLIGFLINTQSISLTKIYELSKDRANFFNKLKAEVVNSFTNTQIKELITKKDKALILNKLKDITYDTNKKDLRHFYLFINIAILLTLSTKTTSHQKHSRFLFDVYKKEKWDLEHIHAQADTSQDDLELDSLSNLTLLPASINRSYKDAIFSDKRRRIIEEYNQGAFIPICTLMVFLNAYLYIHDLKEDSSIELQNNTIEAQDKWDSRSKDAYLSYMANLIFKFF